MFGVASADPAIADRSNAATAALVVCTVRSLLSIAIDRHVMAHSRFECLLFGMTRITSRWSALAGSVSPVQLSKSAAGSTTAGPRGNCASGKIRVE
jgi:hypothetical protein